MSNKLDENISGASPANEGAPLAGAPSAPEPAAPSAQEAAGAAASAAAAGAASPEAAPQVDASAAPAPATSGGSAAPAKGKRRGAVVAVALVALAVVVALAAFLILRQGDGFSFDPNAQQGQAPYKTAEEVQAELDRIVEEGMFNISISSVIKFADGTSEGIAYIENVPGNRYHMQVTITLDDTGQVVYESAAIAPDSYVEAITLSQDLDAGTYEATATFTAIDQDTHEEAGKAAAKVQLVVEG